MSSRSWRGRGPRPACSAAKVWSGTCPAPGSTGGAAGGTSAPRAVRPRRTGPRSACSGTSQGPPLPGSLGDGWLAPFRGALQTAVCAAPSTRVLMHTVSERCPRSARPCVSVARCVNSVSSQARRRRGLGSGRRAREEAAACSASGLAQDLSVTPRVGLTPSVFSECEARGRRRALCAVPVACSLQLGSSGPASSHVRGLPGPLRPHLRAAVGDAPPSPDPSARRAPRSRAGVGCLGARTHAARGAS